MGVQGLWQVLEPVGKPVDINRLRGKVFAIDVSIWLHQAVKGYRDKDGNPLPNAHLLGVFFRVCKLLNYGIKPVFVFDGGVPVLKKQTMAVRKSRKIEAMDKSEMSRKKLLTNYLQQEILRQTRQALPPTLRIESALAKISPRKDKSRSPTKSSGLADKDIAEDLEMFRGHWSGRTEDDGEKFTSTISDDDSNSSYEYEEQYSRDYSENFSSIMSDNFDALPLETQHEILFEMQESKKNNSWGKIHQMPKDLQDFSSFQMDRLVKRRTLQKKIQQVQQEMGQRHIHVQNLDDLLKMEYDFDENKSEVIASQEGGFVLVKTKTNGESNGKADVNTDSKLKTVELNGKTEEDLNKLGTEDAIAGSSQGILDNQEFNNGHAGKTEEERFLLAVEMSKQESEAESKKTGLFGGYISSDEVRGILSRIQARLTEQEDKLNAPAELITIDSDSSDGDNDNIHSSSNADKSIKKLVSSLKIPSKVNLGNHGGVPKISFGKSPLLLKRVQFTNCNAGKNPELIILEDSDECKEMFVDKKNEIMENLAIVELEEDQLDLAIKLSMSKSGDEEDSCKIVFDNTPTKEVSKVVTAQTDSSASLAVLEEINKQRAAIANSSCAKFLDAIGFSENIPIQEVNDSSGSDFEEVEELPHTVTPVVPTLSSSSIIDDKVSNEEENVDCTKASLTITLPKDSLIVPPEDDIFSDIFATNTSVTTTPSFEKELISLGSQVKSSAINGVTAEMNNGVNQDEDNGMMEPEILSGPESDSSLKEDAHGENDLTTPTVPNETNDTDTMEMDSESNAPENINVESEVTDSTVEINPSNAIPSSSNQKIARTLGTMPSNHSVKMITAEYLQAQQNLNTEQGKLQQAKGFQERVATSITDQMYIEAQELLALFGIPYVISPMEAESQCAFFDTACLTDGTLTDDSDVWLFGGRRVYKNFFSQGDKHVEFYQYADIVRVLSLDREKLVLIAMLTGSDYTEGVEGVGPVTALEIISEFLSKELSPLESLTAFREWWDATQFATAAMEIGNKVREKFRKLKLRPGFPNKAVYDAYLEPTIDNSTEPFKWGNPDLDALRTYTKMKFGWDQSKCDATLLPVIKNLKCQANEMDRQMTMDRFLIFGDSKSTFKRKVKSQRLARAVKKIKRAAPSGEINLSSSDSDDNEDGVPAKQSPEKKGIKLPKKNTSGQKKVDNSATESVSASLLSTQSTSSETSESNTHPVVSAVKRPTVIPQKVQDETNKQMNKMKAIELFKNKKLPDQ